MPSGKFNAGEKVLFWLLVVGLCSVIAVTGLILDFPNWNQGREAMQIANLIHGICAILAMAMACFHIYLGTVGMEGALKAMKTGYVDETWAREHHQLLVRRGEGGQASGEGRRGHRPTGHGRLTMKTRITALAVALGLGIVFTAQAKLPPPPPLDEKGKAAAEEKKVKDAARLPRRPRPTQAAAEDKAVKNFQANMKKAGKPIPKPTPIAAAAPARRGACEAGGKGAGQEVLTRPPAACLEGGGVAPPFLARPHQVYRTV